MSLELQEAIKLLYVAFRRYPLNPTMVGSPLYSELPTWNRSLAVRPLRQLSEDDLSIFYFKAMTTWGSVDDFRHFLPRIFEVLTTLPLGWEEWVALDKLNYSQWRTWPEPEQTAVEAYLLAFWNELLTTLDESADAFCGHYFAAIANVYPNVNELLRRWEQAPSVGLIRLGCYAHDNYYDLRKKKRLSAFDQRTDLAPAVLAWLATDTMLAQLESAFLPRPIRLWQRKYQALCSYWKRTGSVLPTNGRRDVVLFRYLPDYSSQFYPCQIYSM